MTVITFATSKGGAGKTTAAIILATTLARKYKVTLIDADPAKRLMSWYKKGKPLPRLTVFASQGDRHIEEEIFDAQPVSDFIVIDLEGAATRLNACAMGMSDLVIVPMGDEQPDAEGAIETLAQLAEEARTARRQIPVRILFSRTQAAVKSRLAKSLNAQVRDKIGSFTTELHSRLAYSALHSIGGSLYTMSSTEVSGLPKAIANAELFVEEVHTVLGWVEDINGRRRRPNPEKKEISNA